MDPTNEFAKLCFFSTLGCSIPNLLDILWWIPFTQVKSEEYCISPTPFFPLLLSHPTQKMGKQKYRSIFWGGTKIFPKKSSPTKKSPCRKRVHIPLEFSNFPKKSTRLKNSRMVWFVGSAPLKFNKFAPSGTRNIHFKMVVSVGWFQTLPWEMIVSPNIHEKMGSRKKYWLEDKPLLLNFGFSSGSIFVKLLESTAYYFPEETIWNPQWWMNGRMSCIL